jgi:hypothetical protein
MHAGSRFHKKRSIKSGLPPGTLVHIGDESNKTVKISVIGYAPDRIAKKGKGEEFAFSVRRQYHPK